jgi:hypothetical protein
VSSLGNIKGVAFREFLAWYEMRRGSTSIARAVADVERRHGAGLVPEGPHFGVLSSRWYDAAVVHDLLDRLTAGCSDEELAQMAEDAASHVMGTMLRGVYRTMFSLFATPERYVRYVDKLWSTSYDTGSVVIQIPEPNVHRVTYAGWTSHHPFICRMNMAAARPIFEAMRCEDVRVRRLSCVSSGAPVCENVVRWRDPSTKRR